MANQESTGNGQVSRNGQGSPKVALAVTQLSKTFPGTRALKGVSFSVGAGRIHGLVGGNGSGKSTLIKILAGIYQADAGGEIAVGDTTIPANSTTPELARSFGLRFVHQNGGTFPAMTVAENIAFGGNFPTRAGAIRWRALRAHTKLLLDRFQIEASPDDLVGDLRAADQTMVAIARALQDEEDGQEDRVSILILDEPTASLPEHEVEVLLSALRRYAAQGQTILYVSHRLEEILSLTDEVTVFRDGEHVITCPTSTLDEKSLIRHIVGRPLSEVFATDNSAVEAETVLNVSDLSGGPLKGATFTVKKGEVVGIAGLLGSGRTELLEMIFGSRRPDGGKIELDGKVLDLSRPIDGIHAGIGFVPEHREADAAFLDMTVRENLSASHIQRFSRRGRLSHRAEQRDAIDSIDEFGIRTAGDKALMSSLSGGNQQKVIIARWLRNRPMLLLLDEPTQGVDVGARADAYASIREAVQSGMAAVIVSSDFEELASACDRVLVLRNGRFVAEVKEEQLTRHGLTEQVLATQEGSR
jgi:ribose transport system ATP-binding protein